MDTIPHEEKTIGTHQYRVEALPMDKWSRLSEFLSEFLGEPITSLVKGFDIGDLHELMLGDAGALGVLCSVVSSKITTGRMGMLTNLMGDALSVLNEDGQWTKLSQAVQNNWWAQNRGELPPVVWLFLKVQYADFFTGFGALMPNKKPNEKGQEKSTKVQGDESPDT